MKSCVYIRVSTNDQNTDMQLRALDRYCKNHDIAYDLYEEKLSGTTTDRPELQRLITAIRSKKYDKLIVWKLDRFSRSVSDLIQLLTTVTDNNCGFVSLHENIDMSTAVGRMMFHIMASFAQFTSDTIRENVTAGLAAKRARGERLGRAPMRLNIPEIQKKRRGGVKVSVLAKKYGISTSQLYARLRSV